MYTEVHYMSDAQPPSLMFLGPDGGWMLPIQAIADRMELYGLESVEQTLEYLGREKADGQLSDTLHEPVQRAYAEVVWEEFRATLDGAPLASQRQTLMSPVEIKPSLRSELEEVREWALDEQLGMRSTIHSFGGARLLDARRPVERTVPAAAEAVGAEEAAISAAVDLVHGHPQEFELWRVFNLGTYEPRVWAHMRQMEEEQ